LATLVAGSCGAGSRGVRHGDQRAHAEAHGRSGAAFACDDLLRCGGRRQSLGRRGSATRQKAGARASCLDGGGRAASRQLGLARFMSAVRIGRARAGGGWSCLQRGVRERQAATCRACRRLTRYQRGDQAAAPRDSGWKAGQRRKGGGTGWIWLRRCSHLLTANRWLLIRAHCRS
jgi:hypothetical protein